MSHNTAKYKGTFLHDIFNHIKVGLCRGGSGIFVTYVEFVNPNTPELIQFVYWSKSKKGKLTFIPAILYAKLTDPFDILI